MDRCSRRGFIQGAACMAAGAAGLTASAGATAALAEEAAGASYDVVVVGFGGAGASAAIAAADLGAKVLVVEKAPEGWAGGNTRLSGQQVLCPSDLEAAVGYLVAIQDQFSCDEELIRATTQEMMANEQALTDLGAKVEYITYSEFPEVPGSETMTCCLVDGERSTGKAWAAYYEGVLARADSIDVWYESPAKRLVLDAEGAVTGVVVEHEGGEVEIAAAKGVIMACGGFENNQDMIQCYLHLPYGYPKGTPYNTGDGILMAMRAGAALWHMNNPAGPDLNFKDPETNAYYGYSLAMGIGSRTAIFVGPDGTRFTNEALMTRHGKLPFHGTYQTAFVALPAHLVFDDAAFAAGPVCSNSWSADNQAELEQGWIVKADTLEELAGLIGVPADGLAAGVATYNGYCADGYDPEFKRSAETLVPLAEQGPYYAMELFPTFTNTQGGAVRNASCQVMGVDGAPIAGLYSAGEFGSMYAHGYNGGGNVGEAFATGRMAARACMGA